MRKALRTIWSIITFPFRLLIAIPRSLVRNYRNFKEFFGEEAESAPLTDSVSAIANDPRVLAPHLNDLRKTVFRSVAALAICSALAFIFIQPILGVLTRPIGGIGELQAIEVTESIGTVMRVALLAGFAISLPFIVFQFWRFFVPGMTGHERWVTLMALPVVTVFFLAGMAFAYFIMLPVALPFLLNFANIKTIARPSSYITFTVGIMFWIGVSFEFPLAIYLMARLGLIKAKVLWQQWRLAIVIIALIAALVTPTVDPVNMSIVMLPLIILYFLSIGLASIAQRQRTTT
jgi:sec-independent protein translocase protein TatC